VGVGDDQLYAGQAAAERQPAGAALPGGHLQPEDLPVPVDVDPGGNQRGDVDDPAVVTDPHRQRVDPAVGVGPGVQRSVAKRRHLSVQALGQLRDLGLGQLVDAQGGDQFLHPPSGHPQQVAGSHHRGQRLLRPPPRRHQPIREIAAGAQLGDPDVQRADPGVEIPVPVAVARVHPLRADLAVAGTADRVGLRSHQRGDERRHHLSQQVRGR
jgi:hypothetical protein